MTSRITVPVVSTSGSHWCHTQQDSTTEEEGSRQFERHDSNKLLVIHEQLSSISSASVVLVLECLM